MMSTAPTRRAPTRRSVTVGVVALAATSAVSTMANAAGASPLHHEIEISSFRFEPAHITVAVGDTIRWTNRDLAPHTATATEFGWDTGELGLGESAKITVTEGMETTYFCVFHPHMKGSLTVKSQ